MKQLIGQDTIVNSSLMETSTHGTQAFPFALYLDDFSHFKNDSICWHWHEEVQITYIHEGEFICHVGSEKIYMSPGDLIFINSRALHQIVPCRRNSGKLYAFLWRAELISQPGSDLYRHCIEPLIASPMRHFLFASGHELNKQIRSSLRMMINTTLDALPFYELRICSQLTRIWLRLCEYSSGAAADLSGAQLNAREKDEEKVKLAMSFIQDNFSEKLSLDAIDLRVRTPISTQELADAAGFSLSHYHHIFEAATGMSPGRYITYRRLACAAALLREGKSVSEAAGLSGFGSDTFFITTFKKNVGMTPYRYACRCRPEIMDTP